MFENGKRYNLDFLMCVHREKCSKLCTWLKSRLLAQYGRHVMQCLDREHIVNLIILIMCIIYNNKTFKQMRYALFVQS